MSTAALSTREDSAVRDAARVAVFAALIVAFTLVPGIYLFAGTVPLTMQTLGVTLAATVLGPRRGVLAVLVYLALIAVGLPVASGFAGGLGVFAGPTGGYLVGFVPAALVIGWLAQRALWYLRGPRLTLGLAMAALAGIPVVYAVGIPWLMLTTGLPLDTAVMSGLVIFLPGDVLKAVLAAGVTAGVARALPGALGR